MNQFPMNVDVVVQDLKTKIANDANHLKNQLHTIITKRLEDATVTISAKAEERVREIADASQRAVAVEHDGYHKASGSFRHSPAVW